MRRTERKSRGFAKIGNAGALEGGNVSSDGDNQHRGRRTETRKAKAHQREEAAK